MDRVSVDFDSFSRNYDTLRGTSVSRLMPWVREVAEYASMGRGDSVLDIGCGTGRYTVFFEEFCRNIVGVDRSKGMLSKTHKSKKSETEFVRGDALYLPFGNETFDHAVMFMAFHHFSEEQRIPLLLEVKRVIRNGGRLVILTNSHARMARSKWRYFPGFLEIDYRRFPNMKQMNSCLRKSGFETGHKSVRKVFGSITTEEFLRKVEGKYVSTLTLMNNAEFKEGFGRFVRKIRELYPVDMPDEQEFMLVRGTKTSQP